MDVLIFWLSINIKLKYTFIKNIIKLLIILFLFLLIFSYNKSNYKKVNYNKIKIKTIYPDNWLLTILLLYIILKN